jgi:hypothetical protein
VIHWPSYNQSLVRRGEILFAYDFLDIWDYNLDKMNENKKGKPYSFPDSFILIIGYIRIYFHLPYRQTEGVIKATGKNLPDHPSYSQICRRVNKLDISTKRSYDDDDDDKDIIIAIDSTGVKITNRGQWMQEKWNIKKKKGYLKIHIAVNIKTKEILALDVTDEKSHDGQIMPKLITYILKRSKNNIKIKSALDDGSYDCNKSFKYLQKKKIKHAIKVRKDSIILRKNNSLRNREVYSQLKDLFEWKMKRRYGRRWIAETVFSSIKRMFGEHTSATRFQNMVKEMTMKVSLYNLFRRLA